MNDKRKLDHIELTRASQIEAKGGDPRFFYEPLFHAHPDTEAKPQVLNFLGKNLKAPIWISSMTGGVGPAGHINRNLATAAAEFGLGMGLGSCRRLLEDNEYFEDFNLRPILGEAVPFYANLGICQVEELLEKKEFSRIEELVERLQVDGLIVHINPLQEWLQPEGDRQKRPALESLENIVELSQFPIIVKEVGQGFGPKSLEALIKMPLSAVDFGAFGGTNFSKLELLRGPEKRFSTFGEMANIGHSAEEMILEVNRLISGLGDRAQCREFIISGGVKSFLDGFYFTSLCKENAIYGQASAFLEHAKDDYGQLKEFVQMQIEGLVMAKRFLAIKE